MLDYKEADDFSGLLIKKSNKKEAPASTLRFPAGILVKVEMS